MSPPNNRRTRRRKKGRRLLLWDPAPLTPWATGSPQRKDTGQGMWPEATFVKFVIEVLKINRIDT